MHNDAGYCKFGEKCRKRHYNVICSLTNCDKMCEGRHPKYCKFYEKCKFFKKNICAFKHVTLANDDEGNKALKVKLNHLEMENQSLKENILENQKLQEETNIWKLLLTS